ncbi:MAG: hypothetical protein HQL12_08245 [Candidatus Omnitrophica bacterium]|nr:hypothetical protein [Candidatus Omnitrophota bacterium]
MFDLRLSKIAFPSEQLDRKTKVFEGTRFSSVPFLTILLMVTIGTALGQDKGGLMQGIGVFFIFIWFVFLGRGGFNVLFKQITLYDLMKRYKFKAKEENLSYERRF